MRAMFARFAAAALLWAPLLLWLVWWVAPVDSLRIHLATATALALLGSAALHNLFALPTAAAAPGRYRVVPAAPHRPMLVAAIGVSSLGWGGWRAVSSEGDALMFSALCSGAVALWVALRRRADPLWGTWMEIHDEVLRVHCPRGGDWAVPLSHARTLHLRQQDGSFLLETPWPERDVFVPSPSARARYAITDHQEFFERLARLVPVRQTQTLLGVLRRRQGLPADAP